MIKQIEPWIDDAELVELKAVIESTFVTEGAYTSEFEKMCRALTGAKHAIAVANGTLALYSTLKALNIGAGDEVIVPDLTFIATANAVIMAGATPIFCDIRQDTYCIDSDLLKAKITPRTKAVMPVHLYGQSADMARLCDICAEMELRVIEDAAQGVGVKFNGQHVGTFGDLGILSFYGNKTVTCGEGGIILTENDDLAARCYKLKNHGRAKKGVFVHEDIGFNFSFTEMQAAVGVAQLKKLSRIIEKKAKIRSYYLEGLQDVQGVRGCFIDQRTSPVHWFTSIVCDDAENLSSYLYAKRIQTRRFFYPLHRQPCYAKNGFLTGMNAAPFPISDKIFHQGLSLPSAFSLTEDEQDFVISEIKAYCENRL